VAAGWTVNGITTLQKGAPLVINVASSQLNTGTGNRANITCADVDKPEQVGQWFDTGCFTAPAAFEFGDSGVGHVRGPGIVNFDISAFKRFNFTERNSLEFRAEFFNLFNDAHFDNPGASLGAANFGVISNTVLTPREVQLGLVLSF